MPTDTADETDRLPDDFGVAGRAAAHVPDEGERRPGMIRGSYRIKQGETVHAVRVLLSLDEQDELPIATAWRCSDGRWH